MRASSGLSVCIPVCGFAPKAKSLPDAITPRILVTPM
jgi:hypothetical protein